MLGRFVGAAIALTATACSFDPSGLTGGAADVDAPTAATDGRPPIDAPTGGGPDAPTQCGDADGDTVCDAQDRCPGHDDRHDLDSDGTPDDCDDWDCGAQKPSISLPASTGSSLNASIELWSWNFGPNVVEVSPGASLGYGDTVAMRDSNGGCTGCNDQVEIGWADGARFQCVDFGDPPQSQTQRRVLVDTVTMPTSPGRHDVVIKVAQASSCTAGGGSRVNGWWEAAPTQPIVAAVCVR